MSHPFNDHAVCEEKMISLAQRDNLNAFNQLVLSYQDIVYQQALWVLNEAEAAEDATQEAFLQAYRKLHTFRGGSFRAWVLKIVTNYCLDQVRTATRHPWIPLDQYDLEGEEIEPYWLKDPGETPEQVGEREETNEVIARAIQRLSPEYRVVVILVDLQELEYQEVSTILHIPVGTVRSRLARARGQLRDDLQKSLNYFRLQEQDFFSFVPVSR